MKAEIKIVADLAELTEVSAERFVTLALNATRDTGRFTVALSGGSTPRGLYSRLATPEISQKLPWDKMYFFFSDERYVPPDHAESNYRMAYESLLSKAPIPGDHVFRVQAEVKDPTLGAANYEQSLKQFFQLGAGQIPRFDLMLLGLGPDGHTASLFPGTPAVHERSHLVVANWVEKFQTYRFTLTAPVINHAACVMFLVAGADKAGALQSVLESDARPEQFPAKLIHPDNGTLLWIVDREAASMLKAKH